MSVRDRIHEFDVLFHPTVTPFCGAVQRPSPWPSVPSDVAVFSPSCSPRLGHLPIKAAIARYDGEMFRKQTPNGVQVP